MPTPLWKPGQSGNPAGRVAKPDELRLALREGFNKLSPDGKRTNLEVILERWLEILRDGKDKGYADLLLQAMDRVFGRVKETLEISQIVLTGDDYMAMVEAARERQRAFLTPPGTAQEGQGDVIEGEAREIPPTKEDNGETALP